eukprot:scaffold312803_cov32-Tisochrysis_lutea.AAC.5
MYWGQTNAIHATFIPNVSECKPAPRSSANGQAGVSKVLREPLLCSRAPLPLYAVNLPLSAALGATSLPISSFLPLHHAPLGPRRPRVRPCSLSAGHATSNGNGRRRGVNSRAGPCGRART